MATTNPRDEFIKLRKSGIDPVTARTQAYGEITPPAPVTPNSQINQDQLAKNQAERQANPIVPPAPVTPTPVAPTVTGVNWEQFTQAPIDQSTGLSQIQAPVAPVAQEIRPSETKVSTNPVIDYNKSQGRESEIQKNVTEITTANPALLKDRNAYNKAFGYDMADDGKRAMLDAGFTGWQPIAMTADQTFQAIRAWQPIQNQNTNEYRSANARYNTFKRFSLMDPATLSTALNSGDLLQGTTTYNDLMSDPAMSTKLQKAKAFVTGNIDEVKIGTTQSSIILSNNPSVANALADGTMTQEEYNALTNNEAVQAQGKAVEEKKNKYQNIKAVYDNVETDVDKEFEWKETTDSFKAKIVADRRKGMYKDYQIAIDEYNNSMGTYTNLKAESTALLQLNMDNYKDQQAQSRQIASEQRQVQAQKDMMQYQSDFESKQAQQALSDPATAIQSIMNEYKKLGIPFTSTVQSRLAEFQKSGKPLAEFLTEMGQNIQASPAYQKYQSLQQGQLSDAQKFQMQNEVENQRDTRNFSQQMQLAKFNNDSAREKFLFEIENDPEKKAKALELEQKIQSSKSFLDILGKNVGTYEWNRGYDLAGNLWDPLPAGGNWTVKYIDKAWELWVPYKAWMKKPYWNSVIMTDESGNEIRYSHLENIGVKQGDVLGYGDIVGTRGNTGNVRGVSGETLTAEQLAKWRGAHLDIEIKSNWKLLSNSDQVTFLKGLTNSSSGAQKAFTQDQKNLMDIIGNNPTKSDLDAMNKAWLSYTDLANYVRSNRWANTPKSLYDVVLAPKTTEWARASYKFGLRMSESENPIRTMEDKYKNSWATTEILAPSGWAPNWMKTNDRQKYEQAQRDWINANLRKESGAVITDPEFANARQQYFPQSGDSASAIDQKRKNRYNATLWILKEVWRDENGNDISEIYRNSDMEKWITKSQQGNMNTNLNDMYSSFESLYNK